MMNYYRFYLPLISTTTTHPLSKIVGVAGNKKDGKGGLRPISLSSDEMDDVFTPLEKTLEEDGVTLMRTAGTLTLQGESVLVHLYYDMTFQFPTRFIYLHPLLFIRFLVKVKGVFLPCKCSC